MEAMLKKIIFISLFVFSSSGCATDLATQSTSNKNLGAVSSGTENNTLSQRWSNKAQEVLIQALSLTGIEYKYGGNSPDTGFDCSGFVRYVFSQATQLTLPPTARAISQVGMSVKKDELQPGDLVFFNTLKSAFSHVGIYIGNNQFVHAPRTGTVVRVEDMNNSYWLTRFNGAKRLDSEVNKVSSN
jgi:cell wall-associated NlpC family hydrolase